MQRKYFDINCTIGRASKPDNNFPYTVASLLDDMAYYRIHGASVMSRQALSYTFTEGNAHVCREIKNNKRIYGVAPVPNTVLLEAGNDYLDNLVSGGIKAFMACPTTFECDLDPINMEKIADFMLSHKLPLIVSISQTQLPNLIPLLKAYPELNVIILDTSWSDNRKLFPLLDRFKNLYFDMSSNQANDIVTITKENFGIERLLYGSCWPNKSMGSIKSLIEYADITNEEKDLIASGTACRLLNIDVTSLELYNDMDCCFDSIAKEIDSGLPISVPVIDSHTHMLPEEHKTAAGFIMKNGDPEHILKKMDKLGIDTILTAPWQGISTDGREGNKQSLAAYNFSKGRIKGYSTCNVNYEEDLNDWQFYHNNYPEAFVGIKPYWPYQGFDICSDVCNEWFEYANNHKLLLLLHTGSDYIIDKAALLSEKYPNITFILAHTGIDYHVADKNISLAKCRDNVYLEITYTSVTRNMIEYLVNEVGADKVLYGSDLPMRDPAPQLAWVCYSKILTEDKIKILSGNISKLLDRRI